MNEWNRGTRTLLSIVFSIVLLGGSPLAAQGVGETPLAARVEEAIDRGADFLMREFDANQLGPVMRGYPLGSRALIAYALLESGVSTADPVIEKLFVEMQEQSFLKVYGVSLYVLALHAYRVRSIPLRAGSDAEGVTAVPGRSLLPGPEDKPIRDEIARAVEWLLRVRMRGQGTWGYGALDARDRWVDFSNTQFAALALHVGLLEGVEISTTVFEEMVDTFSKNAYAGEDPISIVVDRAPWLEDDDAAADETEGQTAPAGVPIVGRPLSWGYRPVAARGRRGGRGAGSWGTTSMTAAAVSTLIVADHGVASGRAKKRKLRAGIDLMVTGGIIELSRAWHPNRERTVGTLHRNIYYTLYSLEKALDLAGVGVLDGTDWYRAQVPYLLQDQHGNGAWGAAGHEGKEYALSSTSFALLFLRRATASLTVHSAAPILTHSGGKNEGADLASGRVWVESLGGAIDLDELVDRLREDRRGSLFDSAREVIAAVPPSDRPRLLRWLLALFADDLGIAVQQFARREAAAITGLPGEASLGRYADWLAKWERLRQIAGLEGGARFVPEIAAIVADRELGVLLRSEGITALRRTGSMDAVPALLRTLEDPELGVRIAGERSLRFLTGQRFPFDPAAEEAVRGEGLSEWLAWWDMNGSSLRVGRTFERLKQRLDRAASLEEREKLRAELIHLGQVILPEVEKILAGRSYAFDWILVRQALTGEAGIR